MSKKKSYIIRNLLEYKWVLKEKKIFLVDKTKQITFTLDKVRLLSFMSFAIRALDKMRIEDNKKLRKRIKDQKIKHRAQKAKSKQQILNAQARKIK